MSYAQYIKHWKNHRKDRYYQQCSAPVSQGVPCCKKDYIIKTKSGNEYIQTAFTLQHAIDLFRETSDEQIEKVMEV